MRREICLWVEWSWCQGLLHSKASQEEIESWSRALAHALARSKPSRFGSITEAAHHIAIEIRRSLAALSYGERKPEDIHPARMSYLSGIFRTLPAHLPNFVTHMS